ncbi:MAG: N-acetylmuramoyl-L-alanine amidase [Xenococcaceae cyanobacterium MO_188.B32]|nr:N-acetylmuramoyl-L-alanine amidase [Xenococcaceae cyanobacterium MO_188.B32]
MRFAIDIGHNLRYDTGAIGIKPEDELTMAVGTKLSELLEKAGHTTIDCLPDSAQGLKDSLAKRVRKANIAHANVFVSIHFNASSSGKAYGSEIYALSRLGKRIARDVLDEICQLGYYDRGVKSANFYVLKHTKMPAILVECAFVDSAKDMALLDVDKMARAICQGLIGEVPLLSEKTPGKLIVTHKTLLKPSTEQSGYISKKEMRAIDPGEYQLLNAEAEEEGHFWIEIKGIEGQWFIFSGHCQILT